jgi:hypothetical protein
MSSATQIAPSTGITGRLRALSATWVTRRRRWIQGLFVMLALVLAYRSLTGGASEGTLERSLAAVLARDDIRVTDGTVVWLRDDVGVLGTRPAVFLAHEAVNGAEAADDLYYSDVRPGLNGAAIYVSFTTDITRSAGAAEEQLVRAGDFVAFLSRAAGDVEAITVLDLRGEPASYTEGWTWLQRQQNAITNLEETGRRAGFGRTRYALRAPTSDVTLTADGDRFVVTLAGGGRVVIDPAAADAPTEGGDLVDTQPTLKGVPGGVAWVVDTVRNLPFVGPAPIEWLESRVFALTDWWQRTRYEYMGPDASDDDAVADLGVVEEPATEEAREERRALLTAAAAEIGFPPAAMTPILEDPPRGEGEWIAIVDDPFVNQYPGAPPAFASSFLRTDPERPYTRVFVTMWDPRQVQLRMVPGTQEPESATGQRGDGYIDRDATTTRLVVGAFDGGFQAMHGEFGMMAEGQVYLPPKPWAATVAVYDDGRVGMGSWPGPNWRGDYDETAAIAQIPENVFEYRQNLTSMVEDGTFNPWQRWWWGAAPQTSSEQTFTHRSGLCVTREGFMAFFWGESLSADTLGAAMISARCARAMHLDMNSTHTGLELYRPYADAPSPFDAPLPAVTDVHHAYEYDGEFPGARGYHLRARRAVRSMQMRFPRYVEHDPRDFFYLTLRPTLPGPALIDATETEGHFSVAGLPHAGWPYAFARTQAGSGESAAWVVRIDPRRAVPDAVRQERHQETLAGFTAAGPSAGGVALFAHRDAHGATAVGHRFAVGMPREGDQVILRGRPLAQLPTAGAAIGVDRDGFLVYVEGAGDLTAVMTRAGVSDALALDGPRLALVGDGGVGVAPDGETPRALASGAPTFLAEEAPAAEVMFPDTQPMPYARWRHLQDSRVRYFPSNPPRFSRPVGEDAGVSE